MHKQLPLLHNVELINKNEKVIKSNIDYLTGIKEIQLFTTYDGIYHTKEDIQRIKDYIGMTNTKYEHLLDNTNRLRDRGKTKRKFLTTVESPAMPFS